MHLSVTRCTACRSDVFNAFISIAGITVKPISSLRIPRPVSQIQTLPYKPNVQYARQLSTSSRCASQFESSSNTQARDEVESSPNETVQQTDNATSSSIPWYLQVQTPAPPTGPLISTSPLSLQEIPPLPTDPPIILLPILEHLSTQIGLDDLTLLDLRDVNPPPALGANLIMVLGTARSYKHLNTSADRFCRWLRSRYKLTPYADGLLGRNEMKLKLRRKARRMKLAQSVGNTVAKGANGEDDGITTGWICVNLGAVDGARIPAEEKVSDEDKPSQLSAADQEDLVEGEETYENPDMDAERGADVSDAADNYIGFGSRVQSPRIVVQMFIEEKRLEMDLEGLWDYRRVRRSEKAEKTDAKIKARVQEQTSQPDIVESETSFRPWVQ